jgi:DNA-binding response OmpR family regulator
MKLLIVEDSLDVAERLCLLLRDTPGLKVDRAGSLREGIGHLRDFLPDALVLDLRLPDGNGMELMRLAKREYPELQIMMLTNHTHFRDYCLSEGADYFFDKAMDYEDLVATIARIAPGAAA